MNNKNTFLQTVLTFLFLHVSLFAEIKLPAIIGTNMVLQQNSKVAIWGWADPGEKVTIVPSWMSTSLVTKADSKGNWIIKVQTGKAGGDFTLVITGKNKIILKNITFGDVWICSGQSNMEFAVKKSEGWQTGVVNEERERSEANIPAIRLFTVKRNFSLKPVDTLTGEWKVCDSESVSAFSAVSYFFGREINKKMNIPIGLISTCWGGTPVEAWTKEEVINSDEDYKNLKNKNSTGPGQLSVLYNAMIYPLLKYIIKGAIWYQGESNRNEPDVYTKLFPAMINNWREDWKQKDFPFYYVQIAPFQYRELYSGALLRESQFKSMITPNTGMAVTMDIGDIYDIHPKNKQDVGKRLALWALAKTYGVKNLVYSGPIYKSMDVERNKIRLFFEHTGSGLMCKGRYLSEFEIASDDKIFYPAKAVIDGNSVLVSSDMVGSPEAVRFAFKNISVPNLFNKEELPASSFRTDNWPIVNKSVSIFSQIDENTGKVFARLKSNDSTASIYYTLDGGEPGKKSNQYNKPIELDNSTVINARAFVDGIGSSMINKVNFVKSASTGKKVTLKNKFSTRFPGGGVQSVVNGLKGTDDLNDGYWQGYEESDFDAVIDLGSIIEINSISSRYLQDYNTWIFMPRYIEYSVSENGNDYKIVSKINNDVSDDRKGVMIKDFAACFTNIKARYIKVYGKNISVCPKGHPSEGKKAWLFVDEIIVNEKTESKTERDERMQWWKDSKFGMFIHWGIYSVPAGIYNGKESCGEWIMDCSKIPVLEYEKYASQFNPVKFNAEEWVKTAKNAGMKYIVITSKHHDGFSMFKSNVSDYNIVDSTPFKRDVLKELAEACKKENIIFCFYHSIMDWHHPDAKGETFLRYRENYLKPQLKELLTNYGHLGVLWFDGEWIGEWTETQGKDLYDFVKSFQPGIIINNRVGKGRMGMAGLNKDPNSVGDFGTPEQEIPADGLPGIDWESCMTMNDTWGYKSNDHNWKSAQTLINNLVDIVAKGGNFLLNVGPTSEGLIPSPSIDRLKEMGEWLNINNEAVYNSKMFRSAGEGKNIRYTQSKDNKFVYAIMLDKPKDKLVLKYVSAKPDSKLSMLGYNGILKWEQDDEELIIKIPENLPSRYANVLKIEALPYVEKPVIQIDKKLYIDESAKVILLPGTDGSVIHYSLDGSEPNEDSPLYTAALTIKNSAVIKAKSFKKGLVNSLVSLGQVNHVDSKKNGLFYEYYEGKWEKLPDFSKLKSLRNGKTYSTDLGEIDHAEDNFAITFGGFLKIEKDGEYTFYIKSDDGSKFYFNSEELINHDGLHGASEKSKKITLKKGMYPFLIEFFEAGGDQALEVFYEGPGIEKQAIPPSMFFLKQNLDY